MQTEVTNRQYGVCVAAGECRAPSNSVWNDNTYLNHPVTDVNWYDAVSYSAWLTGETGQTLVLPTEAQWEKAARGEDGRIFPWGNHWDPTRANYCDSRCNREWSDNSGDDGYAVTAPVGSYPEGASPYGAVDMVGNVWEWTADWHNGQYYAVAPNRNPSGPESGEDRGARGAAWYHAPNFVRTADRGAYGPDHSRDSLGFRLASPGF